ncbi:hypothetical protein K457DRAFT_127485 [Linnemannia elongata AG-77]|uniref:PARP catalytic domain-containing protein n=1 Tax=Linnemannia elongata AG-77 TaxID=1314771 RepID=A0A197JQS4_9FUNG|nr:hypothetical protein K457DRAFT_127485 [Linnemannia elongata AG-77]
MTLKGQHLELLPVDSPEYKKHINKFKDLHLINLYKIHYTGADKNNNSDDSWSDPIYFHGTGHCGCIDRHIERRTGSVRISVSEWCQHDDGCETRGILLQGHCREHSLHEGRHYFSEDIEVALKYAADGLQEHVASDNLSNKARFSLFLCKARNIHLGHEAMHRYVVSDYDIIPCYLVIVCRQL